MMNHEGDPLIHMSTFDHKFFKSNLWAYIATEDSCSFSSKSDSYLRRREDLKYDLHITSNMKNYDMEIETFISWISQFIYSDKDVEEIIGYTQGESDSYVLVFSTCNNIIHIEKRGVITEGSNFIYLEGDELSEKMIELYDKFISSNKTIDLFNQEDPGSQQFYLSIY